MEGWYEGYWYKYDDVNDILYVRVDAKNKQGVTCEAIERSDGSLAIVRKHDRFPVGSIYVAWWQKFCPAHLTEGVNKPTESSIQNFICGTWKAILSPP